MFDWLKKLYGDGEIKAEGVTARGRHFTARTKFIGTFVEKEVLEMFVQKARFEAGEPIQKVRILDIIGQKDGIPPTGNWFYPSESVRRKNA